MRVRRCSRKPSGIPQADRNGSCQRWPDSDRGEKSDRTTISSFSSETIRAEEKHENFILVKIEFYTPSHLSFLVGVRLFDQSLRFTICFMCGLS